MLLPFFPGPGAETGPFSPSDLEMWSKKSYNNNISTAKKSVSIK